jgi:general secretion pathway protein B
MSFILDALKKSESDRQRQSGPALFEVKVASPRSRLPLWAIAIAALLAVNLGIVIWMVMRHSARAAAEASAPAAGLAGVASTVAASAPAPAAAAAATPAPLPAVATPTAAPALPGPATPGSAEGNPDDYAPAQESPGPSRLGGHVERGTASGVPLYQDVAAASGVQIPLLRLDLHVFAARAGERFVMINMHKLREGDVLPEGVRVESITPEGAVLSYNGTRFLLPRD